MLLYSKNAEYKCIRTLCSNRVEPKIKDYLMAKLDESYFHFPPCRRAYMRIKNLLKFRNFYLKFDELVEDPNLSEDVRETLRNGPSKICLRKSTVNQVLAILIDFRKLRIAYDVAKGILDIVAADEMPDMDGVLDDMANKVNQARSAQQKEQKLWTLGRKSNIQELVERVLDGEKTNLYKTGFGKFDKINGGLPTEGVHIIAATTSGGKTALARQLMRNLYLHNAISVCALSLEMYEEQELRRTLCALARIPHDKLVQQTLTVAERRKIDRKLKEFNDFGKRNRARYSFMTPTIGLNIDQALLLMKPYEFKVLVIDYISLLDGMQGERQWQAMSEVVRQCKLFSKEQKVLVVVLAQLDDKEDRVRYSKGIIEHADNYWWWNYSSEQARENKIIPVQQGKARDQQLFTFELKEEFEYMTVRDLKEEEMNLDSDDSNNDEQAFDDSTGVS